MKRKYGILWQYQCQKNGTLFYYQYDSNLPPAGHIVERCPVCGSRRIKLVRSFRGVNEHSNKALVDKAGHSHLTRNRVREAHTSGLVS